MNLERLGAGRYRLCGRIGFETAVEARKAVERAIDEEAEGLELCLEEVEGNSVLVGLMMGWFRHAHGQEKRITYSGVPPLINGIIEVSGLDDVLPLTASGVAA